ncbi:MAG: molybdopterin-dependent oxidoreductase [Deltaproteobacteria bacterium]|jgi:anaerobic selenocysteine-containing dehydrogenase|nr:molybdopterin-dependent oxidoreductase [Deltaproteobacteria bacterium]MBW2499596.1 molybdopterin-dependent oxidoreductase [Deltaproteobacteria bacterium]
MQTTHAICHYCGLSCGVKVEIDDSGGRRRLVGLIGDKDDPAYHGYSCAKGRDLPELLRHPNRLLHPLKKNATGGFDRIESDRAIAEAAARLQEIVDESGPHAVATYQGTYALQPPLAILARAFSEALGTSMNFTTGTIDQPGKFLAKALHGTWRGDMPSFLEADAWLLVGTNPAISKLGGIPAPNPAWYLHRARKRGMQLVVIDPRRSEVARKAEIHLQPKPGEDASILAGMIHVVLEEGLHDTDFLSENADGLESLALAVEPFTPEVVARQAGIEASDLVSAARLFAGAKAAGANAGTGVNMSPRGTLVEYLLCCLQTVCGHWAREGDRVGNPGVLAPQARPIAQATEPMPVAWGFPSELRTPGFSNTMCGLPTAVLPDEILSPGEGRVRALIVLGGNPIMGWPDQLKAREAMMALDLLIVVDPKLTDTARHAHYVFAPKLSMETPVCSVEEEALQLANSGWGHPLPYGRYSPALVDVPPDSDLLDDWEVLYGLARELGLELTLKSGLMSRSFDPKPVEVNLDMQNPPTTDELLEIVTTGSRIPLAEVKRHPGGALFEDPEIRVLPREEGCESRLSIGNAAMMEALGTALEPAYPGDDDFEFRLVSRRTTNIMNSIGHDHPRLTRPWRYNPAFMNPQDMERYGLSTGDRIRISARRASIVGIVEAEEELRPGVISMTHSYGSPDEQGEPGDPSLGSCTGRLSSHEVDYVESFSGIPRMSAIPVNIAPLSAG